MKRTVFAITICLLLASCQGIELQPQVEEPQSSPDKVSVTLTPYVQATTKSSLSVSETTIHDLNIFIFDDEGELEERIYTTSTASVVLEMTTARQHSIYVLANYGSQIYFEQESQIGSWTYSISAASGMQKNGYLLMTGKQLSYRPGAGNTSLPIALTRTVARVSFTLDKSLLPGFQVTGVTLRNAPSRMTLFTDDSSVSSTSYVISGDSASAADLTSLNAGGTVRFYCMENMQGTLLPGNTDPWQKVPDSIPSKSGVCTYLEVSGEFSSSSPLSGSVTYRFFLGSDNCSNFDVKRNTDYAITLSLSKNLDAVSWKIDSSWGYRSGIASGWFDTALHESNDLYIGEKVRYGFTASNELDSWLGGLTSCKVVDYDLSTGLYGKKMKPITTATKSGTTYYLTLECFGTLSDGQIWLLDSEDNPICLLNEGITIKKPQIKVSTYSTRAWEVAVTGPYSESTNYLCPTINSGSIKAYVYLVDSDGYNLNCSANTLGYDLSLFESGWSHLFEVSSYVRMESEAEEEDTAACFNASKTNGTVGGNRPAATYTLSISNDASSSDACRGFSRAYHCESNTTKRSRVMQWTVRNTLAQSTTEYMDFEIQSVKILVADESAFTGMAADCGANFWLGMTNPSNIALSVVGCLYGLYPESSTIYDMPVRSSSTSSFYPGQLSYTTTGSVLWTSASSIHSRPLWGMAHTREIVPSTGTSRTYNGVSYETFRICGNASPYQVRSAYLGPSCYVTADVEVCTLASKALSYSSAWNASTEYNDDGSAELFKGVNFWSYNGTSETLVAANNRSTSIYSINASHTDFTPRKMAKVIESTPVIFTFSIDGTNGFRVAVSGNNSGKTFTIKATPVVSGTCKWRYTSGSSYTTTTYTHAFTGKTVSMSSNSTTTIHNATSISSIASSYNKGFWHQCGDNAVSLASNRYSKFATPETFSYLIEISTTDTDWTPVSFVMTTGVSVTCNKATFWSRTNAGTYYSGSNLDGSSHGSAGSANSSVASLATTNATQMASPSITMKTYQEKSGTCGYDTFHYNTAWR